MVGMLVWKTPQTGKREKAVLVRERSLLHVRILCVEILRGPKTPEALLRRRMTAAGKRLHKLGIHRVILPEGFAYREQLEKWEIELCGRRWRRIGPAGIWLSGVSLRQEPGWRSPLRK